MYLCLAGIFIFLGLGLLLCYYAIKDWIYNNITLPQNDELKRIQSDLNKIMDDIERTDFLEKERD